MLIDSLVDEGECEDADSGAPLHYADFVDGDGGPFKYIVPSPAGYSYLYDPIEVDGVAHCYELDRFAELDGWLASRRGGYYFEVSAYNEICTSEWWTTINAISFERTEDAVEFVLQFPMGEA